MVRVFSQSSGKVFSSNFHVVDWVVTILGMFDAAMGNSGEQQMGKVDGFQ